MTVSKEPIDKLIEKGSDIAGGAAGATIGFFTGGPVGAILGGAGGPLLSQVFRQVGTEIAKRVLGKREGERIGATIAFAAEKTKERLNKGAQIRQDDFFQHKIRERAAGEEVLEGVLLAAQREYQEKKLKFYGNLLANIAFHQDIDKAYANLLLRLGKNLSYRQLCILAVFANSDKLNLRQGDYRKDGDMEGIKIALFQEIFDLYNQGLLNCSGEALLSMGDINPHKMRTQGTGTILYRVMELFHVNSDDLNQVVELLR